MDTGGGAWEVRFPSGRVLPAGVDVIGFRDRSGAAFDERIVPGPAIGVVIDCASGSLRPDGLGTPAGIVAGLAPACARVTGTGVDCIEVQLSPLAVPAMLGVSPSVLNGPLVDLAQLWGRDAQRLRDRLVEAGSWAERFAAVEAAFARRRSAARPDPEVAHAWRRITATRGRLRIGDLAGEYGWSRTRLRTRFTAQIGLGPKRAAMIARLDHALGGLTAGADPADVAARCGYADQSHLTREIVAFTGRTPGELRGDQLWALDNTVRDRRGAP